MHYDDMQREVEARDEKIDTLKMVNKELRKRVSRCDGLPREQQQSSAQCWWEDVKDTRLSEESTSWQQHGSQKKLENDFTLDGRSCTCLFEYIYI